MKHLFCIGLILLCLACASDPQKGMEKKIIGEWCNPYTYESTGELKGFHFKKGGVCEAINIPSLDLKTWSIQEGYLLIKGFSLGSWPHDYRHHNKIRPPTSYRLELLYIFS